MAKDHVFLATEKNFQHGWKKLFKALGIAWPKRADGKDEFWTGARWVLEEEGIKQGSDFFDLDEGALEEEGL